MRRVRRTCSHLCFVYCVCVCVCVCLSSSNIRQQMSCCISLFRFAHWLKFFVQFLYVMWTGYFAASVSVPTVKTLMKLACLKCRHVHALLAFSLKQILPSIFVISFYFVPARPGSAKVTLHWNFSRSNCDGSD